jgi:hypothetical protein
LFAVIWKCPRCGEGPMVVSPIGPLLVPTPMMCLHCGHEGATANQPCPGCSNVLAEVVSSAEQALTENELLSQAREAFALGTCRRGLTIINHVLRRNPACEEAWSTKGQFLEYLGFQRALKTTMQEAVRRTHGH